MERQKRISGGNRERRGDRRYNRTAGQRGVVLGEVLDQETGLRGHLITLITLITL